MRGARPLPILVVVGSSRVIACVVAMAGLLALPAVARADVEIFTVDAVNDGADVAPGDGSCDANAGPPVVCTLHAAVTESEDGDPAGDRDTIRFAPGLANPNVNHGDPEVRIRSPLMDAAGGAIDESLTVDGCGTPDPAEPCVGMGYWDDPHDMWRIDGGSAVFRGVAISNARAAIDSRSEGPLTVASSNLGLSVAGHRSGVDTGVRVRGDDSVIRDNSIQASNVGTGVWLDGASRSSVTGNEIDARRPSDDDYGTAIRVGGSSEGPSTDNTIGGLVAGDENVLADAAHGIVVIGDGSDGNRILNNNGTGVGPVDEFIDLKNADSGSGRGNPADGPNDGIASPDVEVLGSTRAAGTARPGATVRLYPVSNFGAFYGVEPEQEIGSAQADASGNWSIGFPERSDHMDLVASQTDPAGNTSELAPRVTMDAFAPLIQWAGNVSENFTSRYPPEFTYVLTDRGGRYGDPRTMRATCKIDGIAQPCPAAEGINTFRPDMSGVEEGAHTFSLRVVDKGGNESAVDRAFGYYTTPPQLEITSAPGRWTNDRTPTIRWTSDPWSEIWCFGYQPPPVRCQENEYTFPPLPDGEHQLVLVAFRRGVTEVRREQFMIVDTVPPETKIQRAKASRRSATASFKANEKQSEFTCRLDGKRLRTCESPLRLKHLSPGRHKLSVAATDRAGNADSSAATERLRVR